MLSVIKLSVVMVSAVEPFSMHETYSTALFIAVVDSYGSDARQIRQ
jgi:hypothetical protein